MLEGNFNSPEKSLLPKALSEMTFRLSEMTVGKSVIGNVDDAVMQGEGSIETASVKSLGRNGHDALWNGQ